MTDVLEAEIVQEQRLARRDEQALATPDQVKNQLVRIIELQNSVMKKDTAAGSPLSFFRLRMRKHGRQSIRVSMTPVLHVARSPVRNVTSEVI